MTLATHSSSLTVRADHVPGPPQGCWSYEDYAAIPEDGRRYEVIDGVLSMAPAPSVAHQRAVVLLTTHLTIAIKFSGKGEILVAPTDVELPLSPPVVVKPDVIVVLKANLSILTPGRIIGAPHVVVEVLSPSTAGYDRREKQDAYARAGIAEYWLADPFSQTIEVLRLKDGGYRRLGLFEGDQPVASLAVPTLTAHASDLFA